MASIEKRVQKTKTSYRVRYWAGRRDANNRRLYEYSPWEDKRYKAQYFLDNLDTQSTDRPAAASKLQSIDEVLDKWLLVCETEGRDGNDTVRLGTLQDYRSRSAVARDYDWQKSVDELTKEDLRLFRGWLLRNMSRDKARRVLSYVGSAFKECCDQGFIQSNPALGVTIKVGKSKKKISVPSKQEVLSILSAAERLHSHKNVQIQRAWQRYYPIFILAYASGMRPQEYLAIPDLGLGNDHVDVIQALKEEGVIEQELKSLAGARRIPVDHSLLEPAIWYKENKWVDNQYRLVFPSKNKTVQSRQNFLRRGWYPLMKEAGLGNVVENNQGKSVFKPKYTPYSLRHFFASLQIENDRATKRLSAKRIQSIMGHSDIQTTYNTYGHLLDEEDPEIDAIIRGAMLIR